MRKPEILAPAGSPESLTAAVRSGADAVYIGGKKFSARNNAANFSDDELCSALKYCHSCGVQLYLAVNTIISDTEVPEFCEYIKFTAKAGIDGYIVQDTGAADVIRKAVPDAVIHGSTQLSIHTAAGVRFLRDMGFSRAVPARELPEAVIERICREDIEIEVFAHGALCMSVSGQCYMSAMIGSRSANRGCCGQACRLPFSASGKRDFPALSLKDLSLLDSMDRLVSTGVDSLKIEGRMKRPEYIAAAVSEMKKALSGKTPDMKTLRDIFSRSGFTDGYFSGKRQDMFGFREKADVIAAKDVIPKLHEIYRNERKAYTVDFYCKASEDSELSVTARCGDISVTVKGEIPEKAKNNPTDIDSLRKQFSKSGGTPFVFGDISADISGNIFIPAGKLNEIRRELIQLLTEKIIEKNTPSYTITGYIPKKPVLSPKGAAEKLPVRTFCRTAVQALAAIEDSQFVIVPADIINDDLAVRLTLEKTIISPPRFIADEDKLISRLSELKAMGYNRLLCHTLDSAAIGRELGFLLHGSFTLNVFNSFSAEFLNSCGFEDSMISIEMTLGQLSDMRTSLPLGAVIYGRLPLMLTRNCPVKNETGCKNCSGYITDRTLRKLPVRCSANKNYTEIFNSDILFMGDRLSEMKCLSFGTVMLLDENEEQTRLAVLCRKPDLRITRGLYYRGVTENK